MATRITDFPAPPEADGTRFDWGIVASTEPLSVTLNGAGTAVNVANRTREASIVEGGDKVLLMRTGYGGWTYIDRIVDVSLRPAADVPITSLQPTPEDPTPGEPPGPGQPTPPAVPVTPEGELPAFSRITAPGDVLIASQVWNRGDVSWTYTRDADPATPVETGFEIAVIADTTGEVEQREFVGASARSVQVGGLQGRRRYRAEVRAITTETAAFSAYTEAQVHYVLSAIGQNISSLFSPWAVSNRITTASAPSAPAAPPSNVRWGSVTATTAVVMWDYDPAPGAAIAAGFQVKVCHNSLGSIGCSQSSRAVTSRNARFTSLDSGQWHWAFVRTIIAGDRYSHWVSAGPPRRTTRNRLPEIENFTLSRQGVTANVVFNAMIRNATEYQIRTEYQPLTRMGQLDPQAAGPELVNEEPWTRLPGLPNPQGFYNLSGREGNRWVGWADYFVRLSARNSYGTISRRARIRVNGPPLYLNSRVTQIGDRLNNVFLGAVLTLAGGIGRVGAGAGRLAASAIRSVNNQVSRAWYAFWNTGVNVLQETWWHVRDVATNAVNRYWGLGRLAPARSQVPFFWSASTPPPQLPNLTNPAQSNVGRAVSATAQGGGRGASAAERLTDVLGIIIEGEVQYVGWHTLEWEIATRLIPATAWTTHFTGTATNEYRFSALRDFFVRTPNISATDVFHTRFYAPNAQIRFRTRATSFTGLRGDWNETRYTTVEFFDVGTSLENN